MNPNSIPPLRLDFVVLAINDEETEQAKTVLGLTYEQQEAGLTYDWGYIPHQNGRQVTVALVSFDDKQGETEAVERTQDILRLLRPQHILILGTAGGLQREDEEIKVGDLVISYMVHYGTFKTGEPAVFRAKPILPPSLDLYKRAKRIKKAEWKSFIRILPPGASDPDVVFDKIAVVFKEIASTGINLAGLSQPILKLVKENFPKTAAVEMEAGGVANHLLERMSEQRVPDYLVIKGISDIVDPKVGESGKEEFTTLNNQVERDIWRSYASNVSAAFARALISSFRPTRGWPTDIERVRPLSLRSGIKINHDCSGVFYNVGPEVYSELAAYHLQRVSAHSPDATPHFFTVCAYDPKTLWQTAHERFIFKMQHQPEPAELVNWTLRTFKHFTVFKDHATAQDDSSGPMPSCARILLLDDFSDWASPNNLQQEQWTFFKKLIEGVPCWAIDRRSLDNVLFLTDYVIIGGDLVFNYYHDSSTLVVTELSHPGVSRDILSLEKMFYHHQAGDPFRTFVNLDAEAMRAFETRDKTRQAPSSG